MSALRTIFRAWAALLFLAIVVQVGFSGYGAFYAAKKVDDDKQIAKHTFEHGFSPHAALGTIVIIAGLILVVLALAARVGRPHVMQSLWVFLLLILQLILAAIGFAVPALGWLHPINALVVVGFSGRLAHSLWVQERRPGRVAAEPAAP